MSSNFSSSNSSTAGWEFPHGLALLVPMFWVIIVWVGLYVEHIVFLKNVNLQALYLRITLVLPLSAIAFFLVALYPWSWYWVLIFSSVLNGYIVLGFHALVIAFGRRKCKIEDSVMAAERSRQPLPPLCLKCGCGCCTEKPFPSGEAAIAYWRGWAAQFIVVKTLMALFQAVNQVYGPVDGLRAVLGLITVASVLAAAYSVMVLVASIRQDPSEPYKGLHVRRKFVFVKCVFFIIILNNLVLNPFVVSGLIPIPQWMCSASALASNETWCHSRWLAVAYLLELCILIVVAAVHYRHADFLHPVHGPELHHWWRRTRVFTYAIFRIFDLARFWRGEYSHMPDYTDNDDAGNLHDKSAGAAAAEAGKTGTEAQADMEVEVEEKADEHAPAIGEGETPLQHAKASELEAVREEEEETASAKDDEVPDDSVEVIVT